MPAETPPSPDRLDLAIAESHRLMDETKQLIDQPRADAPGGESVGIEEERHGIRPRSVAAKGSVAFGDNRAASGGYAPNTTCAKAARAMTTKAATGKAAL